MKNEDLRERLIYIMNTRMKYSKKQEIFKGLCEEYGITMEDIRNFMLEISKER
jgi:hypothetical protein